MLRSFLCSSLFLLSSCGGVVLETLPQPTSAENLLLIVHGSGDTPDDWPKRLRAAIVNFYDENETWDLWTYDWDVYASSRTTASSDGLILGALLGEALLVEPYVYKHIHLVGHSVGSYVIHALAEKVSNRNADITLHATYLDPFTANGFLDWSYGQREFGRYADYAENFYNKDDPVPSTNEILEHAHNFDVTALRSKAYDPDKLHWWPTDFYIDSVGQATQQGYAHAHQIIDEGITALKESFPQGEETVLEK